MLSFMCFRMWILRIWDVQLCVFLLYLTHINQLHAFNKIIKADVRKKSLTTWGCCLKIGLEFQEKLHENLETWKCPHQLNCQWTFRNVEFVSIPNFMSGHPFGSILLMSLVCISFRLPVCSYTADFLKCHFVGDEQWGEERWRLWLISDHFMWDLWSTKGVCNGSCVVRLSPCYHSTNSQH